MRSPPERSAAPGSAPIHASPRSQLGSAAEGVGHAVPTVPVVRDESLQLRALFRVSAALGSALGVEDVADVVVDQVVLVLGASGGSLIVRTDSGDTVALARPGADEAGPWLTSELPLTAATPITDAIRTGAPVVLESRAEWRERYPGQPEPAAYEGVAVIPCVVGDTAPGAIALGFERPHRLSEDDLAFAQALAQQCAQALERARLYRGEARARAHLKAAIAAAPVGMVVVEAGTGRLAVANPQAYELLGQDPSRPLGEGVSLYRPGGGVYPRTEWPHERSLAGETIQGEEIAVVRKDGERRILSVSASPIRGETGTVTAAMMVFMDVTERKRREAQHRAAATRMRRLMDSNIIGVITANEQRILDANGLFLEMVEYDRDQLRAGRLEWRALTPPEYAQADEAALRQLRQHGSCRTYEKEFIRRDGHRIPVLVGAALLEPMPLEWICFVFDLTERRIQERRQRVLAEAGRVLAQSLELEPTLAALSRLAVDSVADLCVVDLLQPDGSLRRVSVAHRDSEQAEIAARIASLSATDLGDYGVRAALESGEARVVHNLDEHAFATLPNGSALEPLARELGIRSAAIVPLAAPGRTLGTLTLASRRPATYTPEELALTSELALRAALAIDHAQLYEEAQRAARAREEMVAIVSHDLRSPLNTISMASSLLLVPDLPLEKKVIQSGVIRRSVDRMARLIKDLLDVTRLGAGQLQVNLSPESVRVLLDEAVAAALPLAESKRIHLETAISSPRAGHVLADRERLLQVLSNLLDNALRFTPEDGSISVTAARDDSMIRFTVADSGAGIPPEELPHIFDRFWQGRRQEREGAGLGLAIVRGLVEAHGGAIEVHSTLGAGTTFTFTLPAA